MEFAYDSPILLFNHYLLPFGETFSLLTNSDNGYCYAAAHETETYKTIGTNFDFGGLIDDNAPSTKKFYMGKVLQFFGLDVNLVSTNENQVENGTIHFQCKPNPVQNNASFNFSLLKDQKVSLQIFDVRGNLVITILAQKDLAAGKHQIEWQNIIAEPGLYIAKLSTEKDIITTKVVVSK